jgi:(p)ppGpp synthase/HD superfamily hydrolase
MLIKMVRNHDFLNEVAAFAVSRHGDQQYGDRPYSFHLAQVASMVAQYGGDADQCAAGWTHDLLEDTATTKQELVDLFGVGTADITWALTGEGINRRERLASAVTKILAHPHAALVKACDRYCNLNMAIADGNTRLMKMYAGEHATLSTALVSIPENLREQLDDLVTIANSNLTKANKAKP